MLTLDRDAAFWQRISDHPEVKPHVTLGREPDPTALSALLASPRCYPLRADHGGVLLVQLDGAGHVLELHLMFTPEGRGAPARAAIQEAMQWAFGIGAQMVTTYQVRGLGGRWNPPAALGFKPAGEFQPLDGYPVEIRSFVATRLDFEAASVRR